MKANIKCILLIDDDNATNFIHSTLFKQFAPNAHISRVENGQLAINYLNSPENPEGASPDLILLDINMPVMNGWEFLKSYQQLEVAKRAAKLILMTTTSLNPAELESVQSNPLINGTMKKPLNAALTKELLKQHFI